MSFELNKYGNLDEKPEGWEWLKTYSDVLDIRHLKKNNIEFYKCFQEIRWAYSNKFFPVIQTIVKIEDKDKILEIDKIVADQKDIKLKKKWEKEWKKREKELHYVKEHIDKDLKIVAEALYVLNKIAKECRDWGNWQGKQEAYKLKDRGVKKLKNMLKIKLVGYHTFSWSYYDRYKDEEVNKSEKMDMYNIITQKKK